MVTHPRAFRYKKEFFPWFKESLSTILSALFKHCNSSLMIMLAILGATCVSWAPCMKAGSLRCVDVTPCVQSVVISMGWCWYCERSCGDCLKEEMQTSENTVANTRTLQAWQLQETYIQVDNACWFSPRGTVLVQQRQV